MLVLMTTYVDRIEVTYKKKTIFGKEKECTKWLKDWYASYYCKDIVLETETDMETERIRKMFETKVRENIIRPKEITVNVKLKTNIKDLHTFNIKDLLELLTPEQFKSEFGFLFSNIKKEGVN